MESIIALLIIIGIIGWVFGKASDKNSKSRHSQMTFSNLYQRLDLLYNDDDEPDYDNEGDDYYDEIVNEVRKKTGHRPKGNDIVPDWVLKKYDHLL